MHIGPVPGAGARRERQQPTHPKIRDRLPPGPIKAAFSGLSPERVSLPGLPEVWRTTSRSRTVLSKVRVIDNSRIILQTLNSCDTRSAFFQIYSSVHPHLLMVVLLNLEELPFNLPNSGEQSALLERRLEKRSSTAQAFTGVKRGRKSVGWSALGELRVQEGRLRGRNFQSSADPTPAKCKVHSHG